MIPIFMSEAEAMDRHSILKVKQDKIGSYNFDLINQIEILEEQISIGITRDLARKIYLSSEYKNLYEINKTLFELVDKAKKNEVTAKEVDDWVYKRHLAKKDLQEKYFSEKFEEIKIGYKNE